MPRKNAGAKRAHRARAAESGISYTAAVFTDPLRKPPRFTDEDFRTASDSGHASRGTRHVQVARGGGFVALRAGEDPAVITFTEAQFDAYQIGARCGHPTGTPLFVITHGRGNWRILNAESPGGSIRTNGRGHEYFLGGVHRGEFGGPVPSLSAVRPDGSGAVTKVTRALAGGDEIELGDTLVTRARKTWALAPLISAEPSMVTLDEDGSTAPYAPLSADLPDHPVALPVYRHGTTRVLALAFDGPAEAAAQIQTDARQMTMWAYECGGEVITDHTHDGPGRHVLIPLAAEVAATRADLEPTLRRLAGLLPTLDITAMLDENAGTIVPPGARTAAGGFRVLDRSIGGALHVLSTRSRPEFLHRLELLSTVFGEENYGCRLASSPRADSNPHS